MFVVSLGLVSLLEDFSIEETTEIVVVLVDDFVSLSVVLVLEIVLARVEE